MISISITDGLDVASVIGHMKSQVSARGTTSAQKMESYAKENRPWTDRTGAARASIRGTADWEGKTYSMVVSGNTYYFKYLEQYHREKYAILKPTIMRMSTEVWNGFGGMF